MGNAYWTLSKWSVNLRETVYGETSELTTTSNITTDLKVPGLGDHRPDGRLQGHRLGEDRGRAPTTSSTRRPPTVPNLPGLNKPANGGNVWNAPIGFSPWGINGGYYYGRLTVTF